MTALNFDIADPAELTGYVRSLDFGDLMLSAILPNRQVDDLEYRFTRGNLIDSDAATFRSFDTEAPIATRQGVTRVSGALPPLSRKIQLTEEQNLRLRALQTGNDQQLVNQIYDDAAKMARAVQVRLELARGEALVKGKLEISENGLTATVDFGRSASHTTAVGVSWATHASSVPLTNLRTYQQTYRDSNGGINPGAWMISDTAMAHLMQSAEILDLLVTYTGTSPSIATPVQVNQVLQAFGVAPLVEINEKFRVNGSLERVIPEDKIVAVPPTSEPLGHTLFGVTAEAIALVQAGRITLSEAPGIVACVEDVFDPVSTWTKASGLAIPLLANPDLTFCADVIL